MILVKRVHPDAVLPTKAHPDDAGFDLTVISLAKTLPNGVELYDTGLQVQPPPGYYTEIVPRSSISKMDYMLANSVGVIDCGYTGNLYVALRKTDPDAPGLTLPCRVAQLIPRRLEDMGVMEVDALGDTQRGAGGFGSTG